MNGYHCFNFTENLSYEMWTFHFDLSLKLSQGEVANDLRGGAHLPTRLPSKSGHDIKVYNLGLL